MNKWKVRINIGNEYVGTLYIHSNSLEQDGDHMLIADGVLIEFTDKILTIEKEV